MRTAPDEAVLTCDLGALTAPDLAVVDALARLRLAAARHGVGLVLLNAGGPLRELLAFSGLSALLPGAADPLDLAELVEWAALTEPAGPTELAAPPELAEPAWLLGVQPGREAEEREEHVGVQEVGEAGDPPL
ncbi:STAS domain-containing protein [Kitasatospora sp. NPDC048296]|uniref:STAS domain-containing protein n=1 Tax=Kitasatospora sp. NPDC048296 TaxID=3364048 RepID=UPI00371C3343